MVMDEEAREQLIQLQREVNEARERAAEIVNEAIQRRNSFMHKIYNTYRADPHEIHELVDIRSRTTVHNIIRGPRTGTHRAISQTPKLQRREDEER